MCDLKMVLSLLIFFLGCTAAYGGGAKAGGGFPFRSPEIVKCSVDANADAGCAILSKGRLFYYKRWLTGDSSALEATVVDTNRIADETKDWFNDDYIQGRILWLSRLVLNETDQKTVTKVFRENRFKKEVQDNGDIVFRIPGTGYSEFYFAVRPPGDYIDDASVRVRQVMTL